MTNNDGNSSANATRPHFLNTRTMSATAIAKSILNTSRLHTKPDRTNVIGETSRMRLESMPYSKDGGEESWCHYMAPKSNMTPTGALGIVTVKTDGVIHLVLTVQSRPATRHHTIEFFGGSTEAVTDDSKEPDPEELGLETAGRETEEEGGFKLPRDGDDSGKYRTSQTSGLVCRNPATSTETGYLAIFELSNMDECDQKLGTHEDCQTILIPLDGVVKTLKVFDKEGIMVDSTVMTFAMAYEFGLRIGLLHSHQTSMSRL
ncbi:hypothetical protein M231_07201 [Tremella mesenterica]|uniref:Nudix hydrolase domain-containing protein n=1 Tax=Tremella mesenterica TaxID=5217 RepID=A0A4Q1B9U5_TREME|nr:uncharacterized protein TREMEDRAFT_58895 [Tremella mesenterica DSM 1558]EIW72727.1 hypothetical protein TREMEDRAFT_58895 [Tremella mesenterica DSM 1558]RXK35522.1 hypothetical protein M231_07201 [Tremella mesenterica]